MAISAIKTNPLRTVLILGLFMTAAACGVLFHLVADPYWQAIFLRGLAVDSFVGAILLVHQVQKTSDRVSDLRQQLQRIQVSGNPSARLVVAGEDEICFIATTINSLLASAEKGTLMANNDRKRMHAQALRFAGQVESLTMRCETAIAEWDGTMTAAGSADMYPAQENGMPPREPENESIGRLQRIVSKLHDLEEAEEKKDDFDQSYIRIHL